MGDLVAISGQVESPAKPTRHSTSAYLEDPSARFLLVGIDQTGKRCWFLRIKITGLYERRYGPFYRRSRAVEIYHQFLGQTLSGALCEIQNVISHITPAAHQLIRVPLRTPMNFRQRRSTANGHAKMRTGRGKRGYQIMSKFGRGTIALSRLQQLLAESRRPNPLDRL